MDAFTTVVVLARIDPDYFYDCMDISEFMAVNKAVDQSYKEDWEKARLVVLAMGGKFPLPWDNKRTEKYTAKQRVKIASNLAALLNRHS